VRRFSLDRKVDESGVSGTGRVAEGVVFSNGKVALTWLTPHTSVCVYDSMEQVRAIHSHGGKTEIVWGERNCLYCKHPIEDHWGDGCGACMTCVYDPTGAGKCDCALMNHPERVPPLVDRW
jgi:hypothetical protein